MSRKAFNEKHDQRIADEVATPSNRCPAYGCPNAASTSIEGGRLACYHHARADPNDWLEVTGIIARGWPATRNWDEPEPLAPPRGGVVPCPPHLRERLRAVSARLASGNMGSNSAQTCIDNIERIVAARGGAMSQAQRDMVQACRAKLGYGASVDQDGLLGPEASRVMP